MGRVCLVRRAAGPTTAAVQRGPGPQPLSPYGASKLAGEGYCSAFADAYDLQTVVLRFSNAYGPRSAHKNSVLSRFLKHAFGKGVLTIYDDGRQTRDYIYVADICAGNRLALEQTPDDGACTSDVFQIGTGRETTVLELAERLRELAGGGLRIAFEPARRGEVERNYADIAKVRRVLVFAPAMSLADGLATTCAWFAAEVFRFPHGVHNRA